MTAYANYRSTECSWLPRLPSHWAVKPLKVVATCNDEALPETTDPDYEFDYVDISSVSLIEGIKSRERITFEKAPSRARRILRRGDSIVSTVRTYLKAVATIDEEVQNLIASTGFAVLRPGEELRPKYLGYFVQTHGFVDTVVARSNGVSYPAILASELVNIPAPVPTIAEQDAIVSFLDHETVRIDSLIEKKQRLLELLEERRTAVITQATTKGLDPKALMKDSGLDWLGQIPAHWEVTQARFAIGRGVYGTSDSTSQDGEYGVLRMGDVGYGNVSTTNLARIEFVDSGLIVEPGDLLFNRTNSYEQVAKVGLFLGDPTQKISFASYLVRFRPIANAQYLRFLLNLPTYLDFVRSHSFRAIGQVNLNPSRYAQLKICVPPTNEQKEIADHLLAEEHKFSFVSGKIRDAVNRLVEYRSTLITNAVTGKIDVRDLESKKEAAA